MKIQIALAVACLVCLVLAVVNLRTNQRWAKSEAQLVAQHAEEVTALKEQIAELEANAKQVQEDRRIIADLKNRNAILADQELAEQLRRQALDRQNQLAAKAQAAQAEQVRLLQEEDAKHAEQIAINKTLAITALNTEKAQAAEDLNITAKQNDENKAALAQMNTELANLDASLDGLEKAIAKTEKKLKSFPSIIDGANTRIINSQSELNSATASLRQIQANLGNQDSSLSARALDAEQRAQRHVAEAQDYLKEKKSEQNSTQDELAKQKLALEELTREREKLNNQINSFARTISHTENTLGTLAAKQKAVEDGIEQIKETPTPAK